MCVGWRPGWGASGLPPLPLNYWWTEESGVLGGIQNQLQNQDTENEKQSTQITSIQSLVLSPIFLCSATGNHTKTSPFYRIYLCLIPEIPKSAETQGSDLAERLRGRSGTRHL